MGKENLKRLSVGHFREETNRANWKDDSEEEGKGERCSSVTPTLCVRVFVRVSLSSALSAIDLPHSSRLHSSQVFLPRRCYSRSATSKRFREKARGEGGGRG